MISRQSAPLRVKVPSAGQLNATSGELASAYSQPTYVVIIVYLTTDILATSAKAATLPLQAK